VIFNIIDCRKKQYKWRYVYAIVEPTWHDNNKSPETDHIDPAVFAHQEDDYDERAHIALHDAVVWAERLPYAVTLYIYDDGTEKVEYRANHGGRLRGRVEQSMAMRK
jgi:hypothetical protein